ncbi:ABC-type nitrate/sulfonate/bicarbonate transport system ATPase subunit [Desulfitispora alkaliphila]|uniref:ABC transporter ATP-binding protein n=1 Tax=Desulfitispora alkaliphila TaxID=622674 RepID=UPI003D251181
MSTKVLRIKEIEKTFITERGAQVNALKDINLSVDKNEFICLLGPSGCGKSTLLRLIAGLEVETKGEIFYQGESLTKGHKDIGMVFQQYSLLPWRTVINNVTLGLEFAGIKKKRRKEIAEQYLTLVGLQNYSNSYPYELSGGMQQRVAIARALASDPQLLLMDEPFGALDAHTRILLQQELLNIWRQNKKTIIFVTHSVDEAVYLADRIVVMTSGPGRIKDIINVSMPRPRERSNPQFGKLTSMLLNMLTEESSNNNDNVINL